MTQRVLILTQYFPPEIGAPQNRLSDLALKLQQMGVEVQVFTAMPHYPQMEIQAAYRGKWGMVEIWERLTIHRSWIYVSKKGGIIRRLCNYFSFVYSSALNGLKLPHFDYIICESPPLFLGISALWLCFWKKAQLIFNVSDLWPESAEKLNLVSNPFLIGAARKLEELLYQKSWLISGQTQGIVENIQSRFPDKPVYWLPNGVDTVFFESFTQTHSDWRAEKGFAATDFILLYAGIIGHAQGLELLIEAAQILQTHPAIQIVLQGHGPEKERLLALKAETKLQNIHFFESVPREKMPLIIKAADAAIVPLKKLELFKGAIPSKIFENLIMAKPVLLGVDGEARQLFVEKGECALYFEPENASALSKVILQLYRDPKLCERLGASGSAYVKRYFDRHKIAEDFWQFIQSHE